MTNKALVVCDLQRVTLNAIHPVEKRNALVDSVRIAIQVARRAGWKIVYSGLKFPPDYDGLSPSHRLYGALKRLHDKVGSAQAHWFMDGRPETELVIDPAGDDEIIIWRQTHLPSHDLLLSELSNVTQVAVVGIKLGFAVQAIVQILCSAGIPQLSVISECVADDDDTRCTALLTHFLPLYADILSLADFVDQTVGLEIYAQLRESNTKDNAALGTANDNNNKTPPITTVPRYLADCGRGGHFFLYSAHLLKLPSQQWRRYPLQPWYTDEFTGRSYQCPLGKRLLDFCDEPRFSTVSMYIKGREWLDEKEKIVQLVPEFMPETHGIVSGEWQDGKGPSSNDNTQLLPWFVKVCDKNGGKAVQVCARPQDCLQQVDISENYVVQAHVVDPLLTERGQKCHLKLYCLLVCNKTASWKLYTYQDAFLCVSPNPWTPTDLSVGTQITTLRHHRLVPERETTSTSASSQQSCWSGWPSAYQPCQEQMRILIERALAQKKLFERPQQVQFEIFSADFILDDTRRPWLIECNFGPVLFDPTIGQDLTTKGLKEYQRLYELYGPKAVVNDHTMIAQAVSMVFGPETTKGGTRWDLCGTFPCSTAPKPAEPSTLLRPFE